MQLKDVRRAKNPIM